MARKQRPHVKIDQSIGDHPRVIRIAPRHYLAAVGLHVVAIGWCDRMRTDGRVPAAMLPKMVMGPFLAAVKELVRVGMWEEDGTDYVIHDYLDWQDSAAEIEERSQKARQSAGRRWKGAAGNAERIPDGNAEGNATVPCRAVPSLTEPSRAEPTSGTDGHAAAFDEAWKAYPVKRYPEQAKAAFAEAVASGADPAQLLAACRNAPADRTQTMRYFIEDGTWRGFVPKAKHKPCTNPKCISGMVELPNGEATPCPDCRGGAR